MTLYNDFQRFARRRNYNLLNYPTDNSKPMKVELYTDHARVEISNGIFKPISLEDFKELVLTGIDDKKIDISENLILPPGCFYTEFTLQGVILYCYYPETRSTVKYSCGSMNKEFSITMPNFVIKYALEKASDNEYRIYSANVEYGITDKSINQLTSLALQYSGNDYLSYTSKVPFTNFYNDRRMCFGGNSMPTVFTRNLRGLDYYYNIISSSPFNEDLGVKFTKKPYTGLSWLEYLSNQEYFPYESLM